MRLFVAGTDTDVGKTVVSALLVKGLKEAGLEAAYQKWVTTGSRRESGDARLVQEFTGGSMEAGAGSPWSPFCFSRPCSPHLAAELEGGRFEPRRALASMEELARRNQALVVEGVGGLMVPLTRRLLLVDLVREAGLPVVLVARAGLGTINHTLLSLECLAHRGVPVLGVVLNATGPVPREVAQDNRRVVEEMGEVPVLGSLPHLAAWPPEWGALRPVVSDMVEAIQARWEELHG